MRKIYHVQLISKAKNEIDTSNVKRPKENSQILGWVVEKVGWWRANPRRLHTSYRQGNQG